MLNKSGVVFVVLVDGLRFKSGNRIELMICDGVCTCCVSVYLHDTIKMMSSSTPSWSTRTISPSTKNVEK